MGQKKGHTGNPNGAPHAYETFKALIDRYSIHTVNDLMSLELDKLPVKHVIVINQLKTAVVDGDHKVISWIADRTDGKAIERVEQETTIKDDVKIRFE